MPPADRHRHGATLLETYAQEIDGDLLILTADGGINRGTAQQLIESIAKLVEAGVRRIIIDFSKVDLITSSGISTLLLLNRSMRHRGAEVKLAGLHGMVAQVLQLSRLDRVFEMYPDVPQARLAFRPA